jgi:photosystem II oxygen-evolving enhancer protein 2
MFKSFVAALLVVLSLTVSACSIGVGGLQSYEDIADGYKFLYPNGWIPVDVKNASPGVDVVFRDLIERSENLSVIISQVPEDKSLADLGTPSEVGYRFFKETDRDPQSDREVEFISAESRETDSNNYYILEYQVKLPDNQERHNIASVAVKGGKLFTFNLSTTQKRWPEVAKIFKTAVNSFSLNNF